MKLRIPLSPRLEQPLQVAAFVGLAAAAVVCHLRHGFALHIVGSFAALLALTQLVTFLQRTYPYVTGKLPRKHGGVLDLEALARRLLPPLIVIIVAVALLSPLLRGGMPLSHDHPVHLYKAWHFWEKMLLEGRVRGWSSYWFFGYPAEELYPIGPDIWVAAFRAITLGLFSWETTYGIAFIAVFAFSGYAIYSFGRRFFGPIAGLAAALFWLLDRGDYREGGWSYTVDWAVWVQILAMAFALLAIGRLADVLDRGRPRDYVIAALLFACALLSHPMNVIVFGVGLPAFLICRSLTDGQPFGQALARTAGVLAFAVLLAGFWFIPMMARSAWTTDIGDLWRGFDETVQGLLDGRVFSNVWPVTVFLGLLGAALSIALRRYAGLFLMILAAVMLFTSSRTAYEELSLMVVAKAFSKIQYQRFVIPAKAGLYLLAGVALHFLVDRLVALRKSPAWDSANARTGRLGRALLVALTMLVIAPFARPLLEQLHKQYFSTVGGLTLARAVPYWNDYQRFLEWSAQRRAQSKDFFRISYELDRHNHLLMGAPVHNDLPYYKVGYTPAKLFKHAPETTEDELYRALSVKYVVTQYPAARPKLELETNFGSLYVYRFADYRKERYTLIGKGSVRVQRFDEEHVALTLTGIEPGARLRLHVANYARWRARLDGKTLPISEAPVYGNSTPMLMEVPVHDGRLVFDYRSTGVDILGNLATWLGLVVLGLLLVAERKPALATWLLARVGFVGPLAARLVPLGAAAVVLLMGGLVTLRLLRGGDGLPETSLSQYLKTARVIQAGRPCDLRRRNAWFCSERSWNYVGPSTSIFKGGMRPCIWAHPVDNGSTQITFSKVTMGRAIVGGHGLADSAVDGFPGGASVTMEVQVNGAHLETLTQPNVKGWSSFRLDTAKYAGKVADVTLTVSTERSGGRHFCFDANIER